MYLLAGLPVHMKCLFSALLQVTNEIIRLCLQSISLDRIFEGYVLSSKQKLSDCIQCCLSWKETYLKVSHIHRK